MPKSKAPGRGYRFKFMMNNISTIYLSEPSLVVTFAYNTSTSEGSSFMHSTPLSSITTGRFCKCLLKKILNSSTLLEAHLIKVYITEVKCAPFLSLSQNFEIIHYHRTSNRIMQQILIMHLKLTVITSMFWITLLVWGEWVQQIPHSVCSTWLEWNHSYQQIKNNTMFL